MQPACFLDRDGVIVEDVHYLARPDQVRLVGGSGSAIRRLNRAGVPVIVVSNQSGIARGLIDEDELPTIHARIDTLLADCGARIDAYYHCPHHPTEGAGIHRKRCDCRKPAPGLLLRAAAEHDLDLSRSFMIGDKASDIEAGRRAGCATILVRSVRGADASPLGPRADRCEPDHFADDLERAVDLCLPALTSPGPRREPGERP